MLHAKFQNHQSSHSEELFYVVLFSFTVYGGGGNIGHVICVIYIFFFAHGIEVPQEI